MLRVFCVFLLPFWAFGAKIDSATFKNVQFKGYSVFTLKFTQTIKSSSSLKEHVPANVFYDHLEFKDQQIPILHENSLIDLDTLDELTVENCEVEEIQAGTFKNLPQLRKLNLRKNKLETIYGGVFNHLTVSDIDLSKNRIKNIKSSAFDNLPNLLNIHLSDNKISIWDSRWFKNTPLLTRVSVQNNSIEKLPPNAFVNMKGTKKYGSIKLIINLIFSHNKIKEIDQEAFAGLENINNLWLDYNELTDFNENLLIGVQVQDLRIDHNQIQCLKGNLTNILKSETTHMDGNPIDCQCLENIKKWVKDHSKNVEIFYSDLNCMADRLRRKMTDLEERMKTFKSNDEKEIEEIDQNPNVKDEVEVIFK